MLNPIALKPWAPGRNDPAESRRRPREGGASPPERPRTSSSLKSVRFVQHRHPLENSKPFTPQARSYSCTIRGRDSEPSGQSFAAYREEPLTPGVAAKQHGKQCVIENDTRIKQFHGLETWSL